MSNETYNIDPRTARAIEIALGAAPTEAEQDPAAEITAARKNLNCKGRGEHWYRMVFRGGRWYYLSSERLPSGSYLAAERRATIEADVYVGDLIAQHDRGGSLDAAWLVVAPDDQGRVLVSCKLTNRRDGRLAVTLPDGQVLATANPRRTS